MPNEKNGSTQRSRSEISVAIIILAGGRSTRMAPVAGHKLLSIFNGIPLVRRVALRAIESNANRVYTVTGFKHEEIDNCLAGLDMTIAFNPAYASGMASSLIRGLNIPGAMNHDGLMILLADMPTIEVGNLDRLISVFKTSGGSSVIQACHAGTPGNPVILPKALYSGVLTLEGDRGAKKLIDSAGLEIVEVDIGEAAIVDVDTEDDLRRLGGVSSLPPRERCGCSFRSL